MKKWIVEYKEYWFDCNTEYEEQILNVQAENKKEATKSGKEEIQRLDDSDNKFCHEMSPMVSRTFYRCVEEENHVYNSSVKQPSLNGFVGHVDSTKWNGL